MSKALSSVNITAQNQFSAWLTIPNEGVLIIEDTGTMSMTITLQCRVNFDGGTVDSNTKTTAGVWPIVYGGGMQYRVGCKTGDFTSGTATASIGY